MMSKSYTNSLVLASPCKTKVNAENETSLKAVDYVTETGGKVDFGKTAMSAYTPEIRANMKQLYADKIGLFAMKPVVR